MTLSPITRATLLGVATGIRSQSTLAALARAADRGDLAVGESRPLSLLKDPRVVRLTMLSAVGEAIGDKLPFVPARTKPGPWVGRIALGGLAGAIATHSAGAGARSGALAGAVAGGISTLTVTRARAALSSRTSTPDVVWGFAEDALTVGLTLVAAPGSRGESGPGSTPRPTSRRG